ncbi:MAG: hypothetical protein PHD74_09890 [Candidatus Krumholzibacteria bacterium]|nr:hypothetical protein [Candidatus Krumholzibacteria bacterium]
MKKLLVLSALALLVCAGCKPAHPSKVFEDPAFEPNKVGSVLITPVISSIIEGEDSQRQSERIPNRILMELLGERGDYRFVSPDQFQGAVARGRLGDRYAAFKDGFTRKHVIDGEFLSELKVELNVDALLIPHVYLWHKDEADYREGATSSVTQVGATLTLVDMGSGAVLWEASDENFREAVRSEDRSVVAAGGVDRRVSGVTGTGKDMYAAPPFDDVTLVVFQSLVGALPARAATK